MSPIRIRLPLASIAVSLLGATALANETTVIYSEVASSATSSVPGALDAASQPVSTIWLAIEDLAVRNDGQAWCIKGRTTQATTNDSILVLGGGLSGTMFCQNGQPLQGGVAGELYDFFDSGPPITWDSNNDIGFSCRAMGGVASQFEKVIRVVGGVHTIHHQMGDSFPGLLDVVANPTGDETFGNSIGSVTLLDNGTFLFGNTPIGNCHSSRYPAVFSGATAFRQSGVSTIPVISGTTEIWDNLLYDGGGGTADGAHWFWEGDTEAATTGDAIFVVDNVCIFQEGQPLLGTGANYNDTLNAKMLADGDWFARGTFQGTAPVPVWAVSNGVLHAKTGDPITIGSTENWATSFSSFTGNTLGDKILCGTTNSIDPNTDTVMVLNGEEVLHREGDPVDVNGNGLFDDDAFIASFQPDDVNLTDDFEIYYLVTLRNGAGTTIGDAFLHDNLCGDVTSYGTGCAGSGGFTPVLDLDGCAFPNGGVSLEVSNGLGGATTLVLFGFGQASFPMAGGCQALLAPLPFAVIFPLGGAGPGQGAISIPATIPAGTAAVTFNMQAFVEDLGVMQGFSNSNGVEVEVP